MEHDASGWHMVCPRICDDGLPCNLRYWVAWVASTRMTKALESRDSPAPHLCRVPNASTPALVGVTP